VWKGQEHPRWEPCHICGSAETRTQDVPGGFVQPGTDVMCPACRIVYRKVHPEGVSGARVLICVQGRRRTVTAEGVSVGDVGDKFGREAALLAGGVRPQNEAGDLGQHQPGGNPCMSGACLEELVQKEARDLIALLRGDAELALTMMAENHPRAYWVREHVRRAGTWLAVQK